MTRHWAIESNVGLTLVGHPFSSIGMGEHVRSALSAFLAAGLRPGVRDIYGLDPRSDTALANTIVPHCVDRLATEVNIFHINGDEVEQSLTHLSPDPQPGSYNIIYPAWELSRYPSAWVPHLERFDEVWAPSRFTCDAIEAAVARPVTHMPLACEVRFSSPLGRRYFGIPESAYAFLFFFDFSSYLDRKNPFATIAAFLKLVGQSPFLDACLVIKTNTLRAKPADRKRFEAGIVSHGERVRVIDSTLTDNEIKNLIRCCDCFVSLHRSEGFGRGLSEAMYLGKPVIATGYSGNMDFMTEENSFLVDFDLVPVEQGQYVHPEGQIWADPDVEQATHFMRRLVDEPEAGRRRGLVASRHIRQFFNYRAVGLRYRTRLEQVQLGAQEPASLVASAERKSKRIDNVVSARSRPWYMEPIEIQRNYTNSIQHPVKDLVRELSETGVVVIKNSVPKPLCDKVLLELNTLVALNNDKFDKLRDENGHLPRIINLHVAVKSLFDLFKTNRLAFDVQTLMFEAEPCLYTSLFFQRGSSQTIHRDTPAFSTKPEYYYLGVWVALEDVDERNGPLSVIRGAHLLPEIDRVSIALRRFEDLEKLPSLDQELWDDYQGEVARTCEQQGLRVERVLVEKGDTIIWHPHLPHGGAPILDPSRTRNSFVIHTTPLGVPVYHENAFFNPTNELPTAAPEYDQIDNYYLVHHDAIDIGHQLVVNLRELKLPSPQATRSDDASPSRMHRLWQVASDRVGVKGSRIA